MSASVSVIIPAYNRARYLPASIDSVLSQEPAPLEVIVVDDGSTDDTPSVAARYVDQHPGRVRYVRQSNAGPAAARNRGVAESRAPLVALLDSDDLWLPGKLAAQLPLFDDPAVGMAYGAFHCFDDATGDVTHDYFAGDRRTYHDMLAFVALGTQTLVFRRDVFDAVGGFDPAAEPAEDQDFCVRVAARFALRGVPRPLAQVRQHPGQMSGDKDRMYQASMHVVRRHEAASPHGPDCADCRRAAAAARGMIHGFYYRDLNRRARSAAGRGRVVRALSLALRALWIDPTALARFPRKMYGRASR
jgi:hypothetical protein